MGYFLEIWLRGFAKDYLRSISSVNEEVYHPHVTLVRPFETVMNEEHVKDSITSFCKGRAPISFRLEGKASFEENTDYVPVAQSRELLQFNNALEQLLEDKVQFAEKLNDEKVLHATVPGNVSFPPCQGVDQYMLRLTGIKNKKIWFSYDFVTQKTLNREESLDKTQWYQSVHSFSEQFRLLPTRGGYKKI